MKKFIAVLAVVSLALFAVGCKKEENVNATIGTDTASTSYSSTDSSSTSYSARRANLNMTSRAAGCTCRWSRAIRSTMARPTSRRGIRCSPSVTTALAIA